MEEESSCTLCNRKAVMQCDSDQAKLCWTCDEKVHSANFLVAKHSRTLLCSICHSLTQWNASGPKLTPTLSLCQSCFAHRRGRLQRAARDGEEDDQEEGDDGEEDEDEDEDEEEDCGEGENQVVPMSSASSASSFKRLRDDDDSFSLDSQGETGYSALPSNSSDESTSIIMRNFRPLKDRRTITEITDRWCRRVLFFSSIKILERC